MRVFHRSRRTVLFAWTFALLSAVAFAQNGRIAGVVKDEKAEPIKGATVMAENERAIPKNITTTSDDKGRFSMLGLSTGVWTFTATAPGYAPSQGTSQISSLRPNNPLEFKLAKGTIGVPGPLAGLNAKDLQGELDKAENLFQDRKWDEAIAAYRALLVKAPSLTMINLQIGNAHVQKKEYDKAIAAYQEVLKADPSSERAKVAIEQAKSLIEQLKK